MDKQIQTQTQATKEYAIESVLTASVQLPGVKVNREEFLRDAFKKEDVDIDSIIAVGPVDAGISREKLRQLVSRQILLRTSQSSTASFVAGIPGGLAMAATIPMDIMQFFGMALRLAQEITYLYGAADLWEDGAPDEEKIRNQLLLYCGVMFGASGAVSGVRVLSVQLAKTAMNKIPQKALTKTFWYPLVKQIGKALSIKVTKSTVAKGISKAVPIIGGVISGTLNFASMMPMANRLADTMDKTCFDYSEEEFAADIEQIESMADMPEEEDQTEKFDLNALKEKAKEGAKGVGIGAAKVFGKFKSAAAEHQAEKKADREAAKLNDAIEQVEKLAQLHDAGILTDEEFEQKKKELLKL